MIDLGDYTKSELQAMIVALKSLNDNASGGGEWRRVIIQMCARIDEYIKEML